jgi:hypothetical protein
MSWVRLTSRSLTRQAQFVLVLFLIFFANGTIKAQSSLRCKEVKLLENTFSIKDSLVYDPQSIALIPNLDFSYDQKTQLFTVDASHQVTDLEVCYRVLPLPSKGQFYHKSKDLYDSSAAFRPNLLVNNYTYEKEELFNTPDIYKTGSLTRGVSFGNSQSLNVNSIFNFQMEGKLSENLNIRADITDQNVPFQPEGNTLQVREFDNITFEVYNEDLSMKAGDILLTNGSSNFMRYYKNVQGGQFDVAYRINKNTTARSSFGVAAAKGQFADVTIQAIESLQGPYPLPGPSGQRFVIVLANTENVYLDGRRLVRGYNHDYTIDYNLGEITFNPTIQITQFSRIRVTFEYSDQNYSRSIVNANQELSIGNTTFNFGYYREKDNKNKPLAFSLTDDEKLQMSLAGDDELPIPITGGSLTDYNSNIVLYEERDTVDLLGMTKRIFVYSRDSVSELYRVSYTNVGDGNGDYSLLANDVNGRVYEWVSPTAQGSQGSYAAVRFVPAPNERAMMTIGAKSELSEDINVYGEIAFSNHDLNQFSSLDNEDNKGAAYKVGLSLDKLSMNWMPKSTWFANIDFEHDDADFNPIDRYRAIEFDRDWSYDALLDTFRTADNIFNSNIGLKKDPLNLVTARYSYRKKENAINGFQHELNAKKSLGAVKLNANHFFMKNESLLEKSSWRKWFGEAYMDRFFVVPGYKISEERNEITLNANDSLVRTVMNFSAHNFYLRNNDSSKVNYRLDYIIREDRKIQSGLLLPFSQSKTAMANLSTRIAKSSHLDMTFTYRSVDYSSFFDSLKDESAILGRLNWQATLFKKLIRTDLSYATSSSREILREYIYVEVAAGEGTHTWRDLNGDGVHDLTEFFEAINFDEKTHIRVFVPTRDFVNAFNTIFMFSVNSQFPRQWKSAGGIAQFMSKFSNRTSLNINKKNTNSDFTSRFNPFDLDINNNELIYVRDALRTIFFFNKSGRGFGGDIGYQVNHSKQLISRGIESRANKGITLNLRVHVNNEFTLKSAIVRSSKENASQFEEDRSYLIEEQGLVPGMIWQPKNNLRMEISYRWVRKENKLPTEENENSSINAVHIGARWSNGAKNSLTCGFSLSNISYEGPLNTAAAYVLLESLQPGSNYSWSINYNQKLVSGLQMNLGYEGRKSENGRMIQMGRMQVTALF